ncbi:MAG: SurA N-terminal domain-containing protein, partial [Desulfarculus sp.]|nr:SurA N-terminal domain-containing protein [Desulfarculus sp.]
MLDLMRKHAGSWIIKILLGAIAVAFALSWGVSSYYSRKEVAVTVNGEPITMAQVQEEHGRMVEENRRQLGEQFDRLSPMLGLKERAVNTLIDRALLFQAAKRLGVTASDAEVAQVLASFPAFQRGGRFDKEQYRRVLTANRLTPEAFENAQRGQIILSKLTTMVAGAAQVSPLELEQTLDEVLAKVQGVYLVFAEETYRRGLTAGAEEIEAYYQEHKRAYMIPEKLRVSYLVFPLSAYRDQAQVTDDDVAEYYESQRGQYVVPEAVHARHILIGVAENAPAEQLAQAKAKAEAILAEIKDKGADFATLAKRDSQDAGSAAAGGDLGFIQRDMTVPAFEQAIFSLQPGELGLVQTPYGFHVVKVDARREGRVIPLEEVKGELRAKLEEQQARQLSEAAAERALDMVNAGAKLPEAAAKAKVAVQQSPLFSAEETIPGLSGVKGLYEAFEGLIPGQAAPVIPFEGGSLVAVLEERVPEQARPLGEVEAEVRQG